MHASLLLLVLSSTVLLSVPATIEAQLLRSRRSNLIPGGTLSLLRSDMMPTTVSEMTQLYQKAAAAADASGTSVHTVSGVPLDMTEILQRTLDTDGNFDLVQAKLDKATLDVISASLSISSGIMKVTKAAIGATSSSLKLIPEQWSRWSGRAKWLTSEYKFAQTLYKDFNKEIDSSDLLGDAVKYLEQYNNLQSMLAGGELQSDIATQIAQLSAAASVLRSVQ